MTQSVREILNIFFTQQRAPNHNISDWITLLLLRQADNSKAAIASKNDDQSGSCSSAPAKLLPLCHDFGSKCLQIGSRDF